MKIKLLIWLSLIILSTLTSEPEDLTKRKIREAFLKYIKAAHPQKAYLHLDKNIYFANERIWFKAYLFDETNLKSDLSTGIIYVELIDPYNKRVQTVLIKNDLTGNSGSFFLADTVPEGTYQIRAYTNWMRNSGPEFFFTKNIEIRNARQEYQITPKEARSNRRNIDGINKFQRNFFIGFFPEGGDLLQDVQSRVAFKAEDGLGKGIEVTGSVKDNSNNEITKFRTEHSGMGSFFLKPLKGVTYSAHVTYPDGSQQKIGLPEARSNTVGMRLSSVGKQVTITLLSNKEPSNDRSANEFVLAGQVRGMLYYLESINLLDNDSLFLIPEDEFPSGVAHFTLFNNRMQPVAERLHFINHGRFNNYNISSFIHSDSIKVRFGPPSAMNEKSYFMGSLAIVSAEKGSFNGNDNNIISELLLTNDLPGFIHEPAYYLKTNDINVSRNTDLLMLTHGWKRFLWDQVLHNEPYFFRYQNENALRISGKITREILEFPIRDADVTLYIMSSYNDEYHTKTNSRGIFTFDSLFYYDTLDVKIVARKPRGGKGLLILVNEDPVEKVIDRTGSYYLTSISKMNMKEYRRNQAELAREELRLRQKELDSIYSENIYGEPDFVIWGKDLPPGYTNLLEALQGKVPGMMISGNEVLIRGRSTIYGNTDPLLLIDGIPTEFNAISNIPVQDVERVEILKGASTSMYGSRGSNGVIAVHTKEGMYMKKGEITFSMLGFHVSEKFYSPSAKDVALRYENKILPLTIYWNPGIFLSGNKTVQLSLSEKLLGDEFYVIMEGIDDKGIPGFSYAPFKTNELTRIE